jgi:hypothetical protein
LSCLATLTAATAKAKRAPPPSGSVPATIGVACANIPPPSTAPTVGLGARTASSCMLERRACSIIPASPRSWRATHRRQLPSLTPATAWLPSVLRMPSVLRFSMPCLPAEYMYPRVPSIPRPNPLLSPNLSTPLNDHLSPTALLDTRSPSPFPFPTLCLPLPHLPLNRSALLCSALL